MIALQKGQLLRDIDLATCLPLNLLSILNISFSFPLPNLNVMD